MFIIVCIFLFPYVAQLICYPLLKKAEGDTSKAFIPFVGLYEVVKLIKKKWHWVLLAHLPIFNVFIILSIFTDLSKVFGKNSFGAAMASIFIPYIWLPYLGSRDGLEYQPELLKEKKTWVLEWPEALIFALVAAGIIRWSTFELYTIPTSSMESTLLVGDYLFVSKLNYGPRAPMTPLQVPLTHKTFPWIGTERLEKGDYPRTYLDIESIRLPYFRFPGFEDIERGDIVVFNYPWEFNDKALVNHSEEDIDDGMGAPDIKTNYIKRCVAVPGDTFKIENRQIFIDGEAIPNPEHMQFAYKIETEPGYGINEKFLEKYNLNEQDFQQKSYELSMLTGKRSLVILADSSTITEIGKSRRIKSIETLPIPDYVEHGMLYPSEKKWSKDNYGEIVIPYAGMTIPITKENVAIYYRAIEYYEGNEKVVRTDDDRLLIDGEEVSEYTFKQNYYFMNGDNRHNSADSRYWGFVPEDHIVGKAFMVLFSVDSKGNIRWDRVFNIIKHGFQ